MSADTKKREEAPPLAQQRLERSLAAGDWLPAYILRGEERYFRERMAELVLKAAQQRGLELCRHDAKHPEFSLTRLCDDLRGGALFATARCVIVHQISPLLTKNSRDYSQALVELLCARIQQSSGGTLVLSADSWTLDHPVLRTATAAGAFFGSCRKLWDTPPPWGASDASRIELVAWLLERARHSGLRLRSEDAHYICQAVGNDLYALEGELGRLRERGSRSIAEIVGWQAGAAPYAVAEDLARGDLRAALRGIEALYQGGFQGRDGQRTRDEGGLSAMLLNALYAKLREAIAASGALAAGGSEKEALLAAGVSSAPRAQEALRARLQARATSSWPLMLEDVASLERRAHSGSPLSAEDFQWLALRWRVAVGRSARGKGPSG